MRRIAILFLLLAVLTTGCQDMAPAPLFNPGTASVQRTRAQRFDPYPDPQMVHDDGSARPRDYLHPPPEADRNSRSMRWGQPVDMRWQSSGN